MEYVVEKSERDCGIYEVYLDPNMEEHMDLKLICNNYSNAQLIVDILNKDLRHDVSKKINVYRVPQYSAKRVNVICVDDVPVCTCRGKLTTSKIIARLSGQDSQLNDERLAKIIDSIREENK